MRISDLQYWRCKLLVAAVIAAQAGFGQTLAFRLGGGGLDHGKAVAVGRSGNIYAAGYFSGTVGFSPGGGSELTSAGGPDHYLAKYGPKGMLIWARTWGSPGTAAEQPHSVATDPEGNAYVAGYFQGTQRIPHGGPVELAAAGGRDAYLAKFDSNGQLAWALALASPGDEDAFGVLVDGGGDVYLTGSFEGTIDFDRRPNRTHLLTSRGTRDGFLAKYNRAGELLWAHSFGGTAEVQGLSLALDRLGNPYVAGAFQGNATFESGGSTLSLDSSGGFDIFLVRFGPDGSLRWATSAGGPADDVPASGGLAIDGQGNIYITGSFAGTARFGPGAALLTSAGGRDIFLVKYDWSGAYLTAIALGGPGSDDGRGLALDPFGNVFLTGSHAGIPDFDPGPGTQLLAARGTGGATDAFVAAFTGDLRTLLWVHGFGSAAAAGETNSTLGSGITMDERGNVVATGRFHDVVNVGRHQPLNLTTAGSGDIWLVKYDREGGFTYDVPELNTMPIYAVTSAVGHVGGPLVPGSLYTMWASGITLQTEHAAGYPLPAEMCGIEVRVQSRRAPLMYCSPGQVNFQAPNGLAPGPARVEVAPVMFGVTARGTYEARVAGASPAIFFDPDSPAVIFQNGQRVRQQNPARPGDWLSIYATGLGLLASLPVDGMPVGTAVPTTVPVSVRLGSSLTVTPDYAGAAPEFPGVYQVNFQVPAGIGTGPAELRLTVEGNNSNPVILWLAE